MLQAQDLDIGRLVAGLRDAVVVIEPRANRILFWNPAAEALFGYTAAEAAALRPELLLPPPLRDGYAAIVASPDPDGAGGDTWSDTLFDVPVLDKAGARHDVEVTVGTLPRRDGGRHYIMLLLRDVTARRRRAVDTLRASEARFATAFEASPLAMSVSSIADGRYRDVNEAFLRLTGYAREEVVGRTAAELGLSPTGIGRLRVVRAVRAQGQVRNLEGRLRAHSGEERTVLVSAGIVSAAGEECLLAITADISERTRADEQLREAATSFASLFNATAEGMVITVGGRMRRVNRTFAAMLGYEVEDLEGGDPVALAVPEDRERVRAHMLAGYEAPYEALFVRKDGSRVPLEITGRGIRYEGQVVRLVSVRDITDRRRAEEALQASERRFRALVQHASDLTIIRDPDGTIRYASPAAERVLGYRPEELVGRNRAEFLHPDDSAAIVADIAAIHAQPGVHETIAYRVRHRDGSWRRVEGTATNLLDEPSVRGIVINMRDVTERALAEAERDRLLRREQEARAQAEETARLREEFLSIASHELKTPITTVKGNAELLARQLANPSPDRAGLDRAMARLRQQVARLELLVNDLLDVSRIHQGRLELRPEPADLVAIAQQVVERFAAMPEQSPRHTLRLDAPASLPGVWDSDRLDQVLTNLVSNALKYSPGGGEVRLALRRDGDHAEIAVSDQGIGIAPDERAALFAPFTRGTAASRIAEGTGLGLTIAAMIVERHGGAIAVESVPGAGTTVTVRLPLALVGEGRSPQRHREAGRGRGEDEG